ncbi:hypothetical protein PHAVU_001G236200 [Phaseolus vulgaris]|uniref:Uncharacterized protein n=1 Tax=Phaseolus vulgaris TaxID=3885 RepID=V7D2K4_PHAVU|nr:hypothetical protein PHAVU_001G236200g [Phaseolus vulgaris]ESW35456.1 hypothetical protein PHAVU_001G236200g [Phaseolus vulgaris]
MSLGSVTRREFRIPHGANFQLVFDKSGRFICKRLSPMFMSVKAQRCLRFECTCVKMKYEFWIHGCWENSVNEKVPLVEKSLVIKKLHFFEVENLSSKFAHCYFNSLPSFLLSHTYKQCQSKFH